MSRNGGMSGGGGGGGGGGAGSMAVSGCGLEGSWLELDPPFLSFARMD